MNAKVSLSLLAAFLTKLAGSTLVSIIQGTNLADLGTALDVLAQLPMIKVEDNAVSVIGKNNIEIYIDGRPMRDEDELQQLLSSNLKKVELLMAPGAAYESTTGAVLKITTRRNFVQGLSLTDHDADADFGATRHYAREIVKSVLERGDDCSRPLCLNVNVPDLPLDEIRGVRVCRQCRGVWREEFFRQEHPEGKACYTLTGNYTNFEPEADDTDEWALRNGYVSI